MYKVSLAILRPMNAISYHEAETPAEAVRMAIKDFYAGVSSIDDPEIDDRLDLTDPDYEGQDPHELGGVAVYEEKDGDWIEI